MASNQRYPDLFASFNVGQAAGLRGAQFRQGQRERIAKENLIAKTAVLIQPN